jgi:hypothetical protein
MHRILFLIVPLLALAPNLASAQATPATAYAPLELDVALADLRQAESSAKTLQNHAIVSFVLAGSQTIIGATLVMVAIQPRAILQGNTELMLGGIGCFVGAVATTIVGSILEGMSGARRRTARELSHEGNQLSFSVTGGPGDVGLGLALQW